MKPRQSLVVVGNGMAGMRTVEELLKLDRDLYDITVFGSEPHGNYNRIMLSPLLAGDKHIDDIMLHTRAWYADNGITLHAGDPVIKIDRKRRFVHSQRGLEVPYDRLLLATGSAPFIIPVPAIRCPASWGFATWPMWRPCSLPPRPAHGPSSLAAACWGWRRPTRCSGAAWPSRWFTPRPA
jgi:nitrite reductase (NADH) large subunit